MVSRVQSAIEAAKRRALQSPSSRSGIYRKLSADNESAVVEPVRLENAETLALDPKSMEQHCLIPFVSDKSAASAYNLLRTRVLQRMRDNNWSTIMVTGTLANEGKTTTAINLAIGMSQDVSQTVLLVDCDLNRPSVASCLGLRAGAGLSDYLTGKAGAADVIYHTDAERLLVLPNFEAMPSSESLASPRMTALLDHIGNIASGLLVVFDMPPILVSDSVLAFAPRVDALLMVVSEGRTNRTLLKRATQMIEHIPLVGTVLNRSSEGNASGYY